MKIQDFKSLSDKMYMKTNMMQTKLITYLQEINVVADISNEVKIEKTKSGVEIYSIIKVKPNQNCFFECKKVFKDYHFAEFLLEADSDFNIFIDFFKI